MALSLFHLADALVAQSRLTTPSLSSSVPWRSTRIPRPRPSRRGPGAGCYAVPLRQTGRIAQAEAAEDRVRIIHALIGPPEQMGHRPELTMKRQGVRR